MTTRRSDLDLMTLALSYAEDGVSVLPLHKPTTDGCSCGNPKCESIGKHPLAAAVPHGKDDATTDLGRIREWWSRWPTANVGIRPARGMVVVDVDPRHGGDAALADLIADNAPLPDTLIAHTGSGGLHYWFTAPEVTRGRIGRCGLDIKTSTGYLVAPPSLHESGDTYRWLTESPIAPAPAWLCGLLAPARPRIPRTVGPMRGAGGEAGLIRTVAEAQNGERNNLLWWAAKKAYERGGDSQLLDQLRQAAIGNGLTAHAVDATIRSACRWVSEGGPK